MVKVLIKKLDKKVKLPEYKTTGSSGLDLTAFIEKKILIKPGENALVPTGYIHCNTWGYRSSDQAAIRFGS